MAGFRHESLLSSSGENRIFHSHFRGVRSNYDATGNVFILFLKFKIDKNLKIDRAYTLAFLKNFG